MHVAPFLCSATAVLSTGNHGGGITSYNCNEKLKPCSGVSNLDAACHDGDYRKDKEELERHSDRVPPGCVHGEVHSDEPGEPPRRRLGGGGGGRGGAMRQLW
ncbi:hypothetical protein RIF29_04854 [Crotalaria pallida]|uniref:Uncharacterized protein n=1 Tax=Crotalaria pallida TaxID=3830 RepID=A0AAN9J2E6_CROPI